MNKVVLVTGSSKGIGESTIKEFANHNYNVVINYNRDYVSACNLKKYVEETYKVKSLVIKCDISNELEVSEMITTIINKFGGIDVLINNAGISMDNELLDKTKDEFMRVLEVNLVGTFLVTKEVLKRTKIKTIINISSTDSVDTYNSLSIDYCASKTGINIMSKILKDEYKNIKICTILPNWVDTSSVREMDKVYLENELKRVKQEKLIEPAYIAKKIYEAVVNDNIKSGSMIRIDGRN